MIYINESSFFDAAGIGVYRKIMAQCRVFEKAFGTTYCTTRHGGIAYLIHQDEVIEKKPTLSKMDFYVCAQEWVLKYDQKQVYIRYNLGNKWLIDFVSWLKEKDINSLVEIHTFDNINEFSDSGLKIEDRFYGYQLSEYYDTCVGYDDRDSYRGMKVIPQVNGVDMYRNPLSKTADCTDKYKDSCVMTVVGNLGKWGGYERVIRGINEYYENGGKRNLEFNIIGSGEEYYFYKSLIETLKVCAYVHLIGPVRSQKVLNDYYDKTDIAVGMMGAYKGCAHLEKGSNIKMREYCARGIPIIYGYNDVGFSGDEEYLLRFPNNDSVIDINEVIALHDRVMLNRNAIAKKMRRYIGENYTWDLILKPVIAYFREN